MSFQEQRTHINTIANLSKALMGATANSRQYFEEALGIAIHLPLQLCILTDKYFQVMEDSFLFLVVFCF
jgi:hypothetical protein